ncbi:TetR/AcrR family transcriptional regulator [Frankia tisae]|uniref:TetR/AcrR family transcriptional regulator n=1 Tax=Frankia tisae TaxID=2950104 RepID=UPI0027E32626|nr:TetR family transcriptional regulator [Frankia tisae]
MVLAGGARLVLTMRRLRVPPTANTNAKRSRSRRARGSINAAGILSGAFEFCRDTPVDQLSMPRLAAFLDVGVTSIYWYYKSKRELLDAMTGQALSAFYEGMPPLRAGGWEDMLRGFFDDCYAALIADDLACDLVVRHIGATTRKEVAEAWPRAAELFDGLHAAGFPPLLAWHAFATLATYARGFLLTERPPEAAASPEEFAFGINNIILGLRSLLPQQAHDRDVA